MSRLYNSGALFALRRARPVGVALVVTLLSLVAGGVGAQDRPARTPTAIITMEKGGEIVLEFYTKDAPRHVENFVSLAKKRFYDGQRVHRVEPNFVVQFGDPQSKTKPMDDPDMGGGGPGYTIKAEFNKRPFERGVLGMARSDDPDSAGSQVYIMLGPAPFLNGKYTAFGQVTKGMDVVDKIRVGDRMTSIKVVEK
jgi:cyclophilin family peptidyl-prolyl cis-trans isomerase